MSDTILGWLFGGWEFGRRHASHTPTRAVHDASDSSDASHGHSDRLPLAPAPPIQPNDTIGGVTTAELIDKLRSGDRDVFRLIYTELLGVLRAVATFEMRDPSVADELVQDVFLWMWTHRTTLRIGGDLRVYLVSAVRNRARDLRKHDRVIHGTEAAVQDARITPPAMGQPALPADVAAESGEFRDAYVRALSLLTERERLVASLRWEGGMTFEQIGQALSLSSMGARHVLLRAQAKVQAALREFRTV